MTPRNDRNEDGSITRNMILVDIIRVEGRLLSNRIDLRGIPIIHILGYNLDMDKCVVMRLDGTNQTAQAVAAQLASAIRNASEGETVGMSFTLHPENDMLARTDPPHEPIYAFPSTRSQ